jgi:hypothetical protein
MFGRSRIYLISYNIVHSSHEYFKSTKAFSLTFSCTDILKSKRFFFLFYMILKTSVYFHFRFHRFVVSKLRALMWNRWSSSFATQFKAAYSTNILYAHTLSGGDWAEYLSDDDAEKSARGWTAVFSRSTYDVRTCQTIIRGRSCLLYIGDHDVIHST